MFKSQAFTMHSGTCLVATDKGTIFYYPGPTCTNPVQIKQPPVYNTQKCSSGHYGVHFRAPPLYTDIRHALTTEVHMHLVIVVAILCNPISPTGTQECLTLKKEQNVQIEWYALKDCPASIYVLVNISSKWVYLH